MNKFLGIPQIIESYLQSDRFSLNDQLIIDDCQLYFKSFQTSNTTTDESNH